MSNHSRGAPTKGSKNPNNNFKNHHTKPPTTHSTNKHSSNHNNDTQEASTRHHPKAAYLDFDSAISRVDRNTITERIHSLQDNADKRPHSRFQPAAQQDQGPKLTQRLARTLPQVGPQFAKLKEEQRLAALENGNADGDLGPQMGVEHHGTTTQYLNTEDTKLRRYLRQAPSHAQIIVQSQDGDQAWKQFRVHGTKTRGQDDELDFRHDRKQGGRDGHEKYVSRSEYNVAKHHDLSDAKKQYDQVYLDTRDEFIKENVKKQKQELKAKMTVFDGIDKMNSIDEEAMFNAQELWKIEARDRMREVKEGESLISTTNDELVVREVEILTTRRQVDSKRAKVREEMDKHYETLKTLEPTTQGREIKEIKAKLSVLNKEEDGYEKQMVSLFDEIQQINKDRRIRRTAEFVGTREDVNLAGTKRSRQQEIPSTTKNKRDNKAVQLGNPDLGPDSDDEGNDTGTGTTSSVTEKKDKKLHGKKALLAKIAATNAELRAQFLGLDDGDDILLRKRGDEIALQESEQRRTQAKEAKSSLHTTYIKTSLQFLKSSFDRVKQSKQLMKDGKDPQHEYDHFITYPLDIAAIVDKFTTDPQILEAFEWLHNTRGMVWDFKTTKAKKDNLKKQRMDKAKEGRENHKNVSALEHFAQTERLASVFNDDSSIKGQNFLELRPMTNNDVAYMAKQRIRVEKMEKVLSAENQFIQLQNKSTERGYRNQRLQQKTSQGQPVMKHKMKDLLKQISKSHGA